MLMQFVFGDGKNCDDFVYVENVVHGHICAEKTLSTMEGAKTSGGKVCFFQLHECMTNFELYNKLS
jgi:plant 3beta-hydroxysteroid-4alpha-carboxylate 3-dehydrogenase